MTQLARTDQESLPDAPGIEVSRPGVGLLAAIGAAHLWAVSGVFGKIVMTGTLSPARLVFYRSVLSALMLLAVLLWRDRTLLRLSSRDLPFFLAMGMLGLALTQFTYYAAIQSLSVGMAILLQYLAPLWMLLFERFWLKIPLTRAKLVALTLALVGCAMVSVETEAPRQWGNVGILLGLTAGVCFAFYTLMTRHALKSHRDLTVLFYSFLFSALFWSASPDSLAASFTDRAFQDLDDPLYRGLRNDSSLPALYARREASFSQPHRNHHHTRASGCSRDRLDLFARDAHRISTQWRPLCSAGHCDPPKEPFKGGIPGRTKCTAETLRRTEKMRWTQISQMHADDLRSPWQRELG